MKKGIAITAVLLSVAAAVSCGSSGEEIEGACTMKDGKVTLTRIQDNAQECLTERTLFPDAPDSLIECPGACLYHSGMKLILCYSHV